MNQHNNALERFYSLDVLRGVAALSVVFWHWQHFLLGPNHQTLVVANLPLSQWISPLYTKGWLAVDLFFCLSGFVFYWLYSRRVSDGAISAGKFAWLRFSRLYPLHFATLLFVAVSQWSLMSTAGSYFVYPNNDGYHFLLNVLFASSWGLERGYSFNGPIWSVSVEVLLYALFFAFSRLFPIRAVFLLCVSMAGFLVIQRYNLPIGRGIGSFFLGGCVFLAYETIVKSDRAAALTRWVNYLTVCVWLATLVIAQVAEHLRQLSLHSVAYIGRFDAAFQWGVQKTFRFWPVLVLFPLTILALALSETRRGSLGKRVSFIGDISYSSYLLHFPLQIVFSVAVASLSVGDSVYYSPGFMALFFAVLVIVSFASFRYFEMPAQRFLRKKTVTNRRSLSTEARP